MLELDDQHCECPLVSMRIWIQLNLNCLAAYYLNCRYLVTCSIVALLLHYLPVENIVPLAAPAVDSATDKGMIHATGPNTRLPHV